MLSKTLVNVDVNSSWMTLQKNKDSTLEDYHNNAPMCSGGGNCPRRIKTIQQMMVQRQRETLGWLMMDDWHWKSTMRLVSTMICWQGRFAESSSKKELQQFVAYCDINEVLLSLTKTNTLSRRKTNSLCTKREALKGRLFYQETIHWHWSRRKALQDAFSKIHSQRA